MTVGQRPTTSSRTPPSLLLCVPLRASCCDGDLRFELEKALFTRSPHVHQVLQLFEGAILLAVLNDAGGCLSADARQRFEIARRGRVDVDDAGRSRFQR